MNIREALMRIGYHTDESIIEVAQKASTTRRLVEEARHRRISKRLAK